jgi:hypothetical protein
MAMVCPKCNGSFEQRWQCPTCGIRLAYRSGPRPAVGEATSGGPWGQTPWGRILVGVVLSQGLFYGLRQLGTAVLLAGGDEAARGVWSTLYGLVALQAIQALCLLAAGMLAGAGLRQGIVFGAIVGVWNGVLSVVIQSAGGLPHTAVTLLGQPILHTAFGAAGALVARSGNRCRSSPDRPRRRSPRPSSPPPSAVRCLTGPSPGAACLWGPPWPSAAPSGPRSFSNWSSRPAAGCSTSTTTCKRSSSPGR